MVRRNLAPSATAAATPCGVMAPPSPPLASPSPFSGQNGACSAPSGPSDLSAGAEAVCRTMTAPKRGTLSSTCDTEAAAVLVPAPPSPLAAAADTAKLSIGPALLLLPSLARTACAHGSL